MPIWRGYFLVSCSLVLEHFHTGQGLILGDATRNLQAAVKAHPGAVQPGQEMGGLALLFAAWGRSCRDR